jgi:flagellar hook-length control protein FliK
MGGDGLNPDNALAGTLAQAMAQNSEAVTQAKPIANTTSTLGLPPQAAQPTDAPDSAPPGQATGTAQNSEAVTQAKAMANTTSTLGLPPQAAQPTDAPDSAPPGQATGTAQGQAPTAAAGLLGSALAGVQALWAMADDPGKPAKTNASASASNSTEEALPIQMLRMPPPAAVWMQRSIMNSVIQDNVSAQKEAAISTSELDLGADWGGDTLQQLLGTEGSASGSSSTGTHGTAYANFASRWDAQAASRNDLANANGPAQELPDTHARSENIQNLADKMGQAVGQRILSEMEKGQWHLKLQLRPATLGHIEVEMRMRSGEFDAVFTAPNATTRDLLQDGMGKLRETLAQMGMDVAKIHVGNGQTGQSGGDSTPGTPKGKTSRVEASAPESNAETTRAPRVKDPTDGLDVLV